MPYCRVQTAECNVQSLMFRVQSAECNVQSTEITVQCKDKLVERRLLGQLWLWGVVKNIILCNLWESKYYSNILYLHNTELKRPNREFHQIRIQFLQCTTKCAECNIQSATEFNVQSEMQRGQCALCEQTSEYNVQSAMCRVQCKECNLKSAERIPLLPPRQLSNGHFIHQDSNKENIWWKSDQVKLRLQLIWRVGARPVIAGNNNNLGAKCGNFKRKKLLGNILKRILYYGRVSVFSDYKIFGGPSLNKSSISCVLSQPQHNTPQPKHCGWVGHENNCAYVHTTPPHPNTETQW